MPFSFRYKPRTVVAKLISPSVPRPGRAGTFFIAIAMLALAPVFLPMAVSAQADSQSSEQNQGEIIGFNPQNQALEDSSSDASVGLVADDELSAVISESESNQVSHTESSSEGSLALEENWQIDDDERDELDEIEWGRRRIGHRRGPIIIVRGWDLRHPCGDPKQRRWPGGPRVPPPPQPPVPPPVPPPGATAVPPTAVPPMPSPTPGGQASTLQYRVCPQVVNQIPQAIQDLAVQEPWRYNGYGERQNPSIPYHPIWNNYRTWLSLRDINQPYSVCNYPVLKSGCP